LSSWRIVAGIPITLFVSEVMKYPHIQLATLLGAVLLGVAPGPTPAQSQGAQVQPVQPVQPAGPPAQNAAAAAQPPFTIQVEGHLTIRADRTASGTSTKRIKILSASAIQPLSQQQMQFIEGMQSLETVEAFTEKADGRRVPVDPAGIITKDGASGLQATYAPDLKQRTIIFPDVGVGDTLVMTNRLTVLQDEFAGQYTDFDLFPRSQSLSSIRMTVEAPVSLDVTVKATGSGATDTVEVVGGVRRHTVTIPPAPYGADEPGAVSPLDRDPGLFISTFRSYEELGQAYGKEALPKAGVTPEVARLADEITRNINGHRAQAVAIDAWMKKNIRYVALFLSVGRVVPHDTATILRNRFGDCKDKATLMASLLAAKGIASEPALINLGNAYTLPDPPTLAALNHVILYLPEFDVYDDPTASLAAFGVLAPEAYDKPVVRVAPGGARLAHTPAMQPGDHTAHATTVVKFAADGTVTGQTEERNTGTLGIGLRFASNVVQQVGAEALAQRQLQAANTPGAGRYELGNASEYVDPVLIKGSFTLNDRFKATPGAVAAIPVGMALAVRPGNLVLGSRLGGRKFAFVCYAWTQIEDIDAVFDPALPMPVAPAATSIDNPLFTYRSTFRIEDRILKIHRELVSRVPHQSCPAESETRIAADLNRVRADVYTGYRFAALPPNPPPVPEIAMTVTVGQKRQLTFAYVLNTECASVGFATITTVEAPQHGKISADHGTGTSNYPQNNPRFECNKRQSEGVQVAYDPDPGFTGKDSATIELTYPDGSKARRRYAISVEPRAADRIVEITRVAAVDQPLRVAFLYDVNPDCSVIGMPTVRVVEQPKSGKVTVENGTGFPGFPANNVRSKCNSNRVDGMVLSYIPNPGYAGTDSVLVDIIYPDGNASKRRYAIEVK
jgi:hypothetical protein